MSILQANTSAEPRRAPRSWIAETLIVAGIVAFGYFATMLEAAPQPTAMTATPPAVPALEFTR